MTDLAPPARTLKDIARLAGVSPGTVSRALAGKSVVNAETRQRIEALAAEHNFQINQMARRLRAQRTRRRRGRHPAGSRAAAKAVRPLLHDVARPSRRRTRGARP
ncbi:AcrR family transcriptional regulator [Sphingomonas sp. SORGH_AS870]|nr:LacI family DNA-binding transcriptional regulator [Sphingomonas sp. SORGH_AS_0870]MDR6147165.1 AcrR family transcriptional regulator [Sphingomonas sp. SORGH_AS_0870]